MSKMIARDTVQAQDQDAEPGKGSGFYEAGGPFTIVHRSVLRMAPKIGCTAIVIYCYLRDYANSESGVAYPGYERMTLELGLSHGTITKAIRTLVKHGLLERRKRFGSSSLYWILTPQFEPPVSQNMRNCDQPDPPDDASSMPNIGTQSANICENVCQNLATIKKENIKNESIKTEMLREPPPDDRTVQEARTIWMNYCERKRPPNKAQLALIALMVAEHGLEVFRHACQWAAEKGIAGDLHRIAAACKTMKRGTSDGKRQTATDPGRGTGWTKEQAETHFAEHGELPDGCGWKYAWNDDHTSVDLVTEVEAEQRRGRRVREMRVVPGRGLAPEPQMAAGAL